MISCDFVHLDHGFFALSYKEKSFKFTHRINIIMAKIFLIFYSSFNFSSFFISFFIFFNFFFFFFFSFSSSSSFSARHDEWRPPLLGRSSLGSSRPSLSCSFSSSSHVTTMSPSSLAIAHLYFYKL